MNLAKYLKIPFLHNTSRRLLLKITINILPFITKNAYASTSCIHEKRLCQNFYFIQNFLALMSQPSYHPLVKRGLESSSKMLRIRA